MKGNSKSRGVFVEGTPVNKSQRPFSPLRSPFFRIASPLKNKGEKEGNDGKGARTIWTVSAQCAPLPSLPSLRSI